MDGHIRRAEHHHPSRMAPEKLAPETCPPVLRTAHACGCGCGGAAASGHLFHAIVGYCERGLRLYAGVYISQCSVDLLVTSYGLFHTISRVWLRYGLPAGPFSGSGALRKSTKRETRNGGRPEIGRERSRVREPGPVPVDASGHCAFPVETDGTARAMRWCTGGGGCTDRTAARADDTRSLMPHLRDRDLDSTISSGFHLHKSCDSKPCLVLIFSSK